MNIYFDFDGTLTDITQRHYGVYVQSVENFGGRPIELGEYWSKKRNKIEWSELLSLSELDGEIEDEFLQYFIARIESLEMLKIDPLFDHSEDVLKALCKDHKLVLVSLRRSHENLLDQLKNLGVDHYFDAILSGHSDTVEGTLNKKATVIRSYTTDKGGYIIGDTEADISAAKQLGITSIAVTTGIREQEYLTSLNPDHVIDDINQVLSIIDASR